MRGPSLFIAQARARAAPWSPKTTAAGASPLGGACSIAIRVDVAQWRGRRPTKPEVAGSTPAVDARELYLPPERQARLAVAQEDQSAAHAVIVQRAGRRALNPETGVRIPVAVRGFSARWSNGKTSGC